MQKIKLGLIAFLSCSLLLGLFTGEVWANGIPVSTIGWGELAELDFETGKKTKTLEDLDGAAVRIPGYIVPLEGGDGKITEFFLVPYFGACIHVPPPPPNQIVHVIMNEGFAGELSFGPVWTTGILNIATIQHEVAESSFSMNGMKVVEYEF